MTVFSNAELTILGRLSEEGYDRTVQTSADGYIPLIPEVVDNSVPIISFGGITVTVY